MAILGISFGDFGSRKLRFDSQKNNLSFGGSVDDEIKSRVTKCATHSVSEQTDKNSEKPVSVPNLIYSIPEGNFYPPVNINSPDNKTTPQPFVAKYSVPDES